MVRDDPKGSIATRPDALSARLSVHPLHGTSGAFRLRESLKAATLGPEIPLAKVIDL